MSRELSDREKRFVESEFIAKEELRAKRRRFSLWIFIIGIVAGSLSALLRGFEAHSVAKPLFHLTWLICLLIYVGGQILPLSFSKATEPTWHLNPWKDALSRLSEGRTLLEAVALLAGPHLLKIAASFVLLGFK